MAGVGTQIAAQQPGQLAPQYTPGAGVGQQGFNPSYDQSSSGYDYNGESQNPALSTSAPTLDQAMAQWFQANPQFAQYQGQGMATGSNLTGQPQQATAPGQLSSLFQPGYLGTPATVAPTTANAPTALDPSLVNSLGPQATIQQLLAGLQPQAQSAENNLNQTLADFGVGGGQAVGAQSQLQSQLMSSIAPSIASAIQGSQGNQLQAGEFGTSNGLNDTRGLLYQAHGFHAGIGRAPWLAHETLTPEVTSNHVGCQAVQVRLPEF